MKGMLFREDLFKKVMSGEKTMTRRAIGVGRDESEWYWDFKAYKTRGGLWKVGFEKLGHIKETRKVEPKYQVGEIVYLKKPYRLRKKGDHRWGKWIYGKETPKEHSRYLIQITDVRVERVGWISEADAIKEGVKSKEEFVKLWKSLDPRFTEKDWVWVCEFELCCEYGKSPEELMIARMEEVLK